MTQMNFIYETEKDSQTERTDLGLPEEDWAEEGCIGSLGLADITIINIMDKQQGPTI